MRCHYEVLSTSNYGGKENLENRHHALGLSFRAMICRLLQGEVAVGEGLRTYRSASASLR